jgi:DNA mismatch endonuclease (patch repair protein)
MSRLRRRDTKPEIEVRRLLHARGLRYRVAYRIPGLRRRTIDVAFTRQRVAVFIDGCFWHGCAAHGTQPAANADWWRTKLGVNQERDRDTTDRLQAAGWTVLRFWEHEAPETVADAVQATVRRAVPPR